MNIVAAAVAAAISTTLPLLTAPMTPEQEQELAKRHLAEDQAKTLVVSDFNDPDSALFRKMRRMNQWSWCGEVNAKNAYGGYIGYRAFFVTVYFDPPVRLMPNPRLSEDLSKAPGCGDGNP